MTDQIGWQKTAGPSKVSLVSIFTSLDVYVIFELEKQGKMLIWLTKFIDQDRIVKLSSFSGINKIYHEECAWVTSVLLLALSFMAVKYTLGNSVLTYLIEEWYQGAIHTSFWFVTIASIIRLEHSFTLMPFSILGSLAPKTWNWIATYTTQKLTQA